MERGKLIDDLIRFWEDPKSADSELVDCWQKIFASMGIQVRMRVYQKGERKLVDFDEANPAGALEIACDCFEEANFYLSNSKLRHLLKELLTDVFNRYKLN